MVNILEKYARTKDLEDKQNAKYHIYPKGSGGCSAIMVCPDSRAQKIAGIKYEPKFIEPGWQGITNEKGGMRTGTTGHQEIQLALLIDYENNKDTDPEYKDIIYSEEVYVMVRITDNFIAISPLDVLYSKDGAIGMKQIQFKDFTEFMPVIIDKSKVEDIYDIKTGGDFSYYQKLVEGNISDAYLAQFHVYMKGAGVDTLKILAFHKQYGRTKIITVVWDDNFWEGVVARQERVDELIEIYEKIDTEFWLEFRNKLKLTAKDLSCLWNDGNIDWYSCPQSITYEERDQNGKPTLKLLKPCDNACKILARKAIAQFTKLSKWKRGNSHIFVVKPIGEVTGNDLADYLTRMNKKRKDKAEKWGGEYAPLKPNKNFELGEYILCRNKSGTVFVDTLYEAFRMYKEM